MIDAGALLIGVRKGSQFAVFWAVLVAKETCVVAVATGAVDTSRCWWVGMILHPPLATTQIRTTNHSFVPTPPAWIHVRILVLQSTVVFFRKRGQEFFGQRIAGFEHVVVQQAVLGSRLQFHRGRRHGGVYHNGGYHHGKEDGVDLHRDGEVSTLSLVLFCDDRDQKSQWHFVPEWLVSENYCDVV